MRSSAFRRLMQIVGASRHCDAHGLPTREGVEHYASTLHERAVTRRTFVQGAGLTAAAIAAGPLLHSRPARAVQAGNAGADIAVVGAGLAGLACAYELRRKGVFATVYEASDRVGGRCHSLDGFFPGQAVELGGELIDTPHITMRGYAREFGLTLENLNRGPGEVLWFLDGQLRADHEIVDEYRAFVPAMQADLRALSNGPTADAFTPADRALDHTNLRTYLETRGAGSIIASAIEAAYTPEYGREIDEQSALNLLFFIHADRRSKFREFGVFSDERFHVVEGNGQIPLRMAAALGGQVSLGMPLVALRRRAGGRYVMTFDAPGGLVDREADHVVLTLPFTLLRTVDLHPSLELPAWKRYAIDRLQYGQNAKTMVGFDRRTWRDYGGNGTVYALEDNLQNSWETNPGFAGPTAVLTDFAAGARGAGLDPGQVQVQVGDWLAELEQVFPGITADATQTGAGYKAVLAHWPSEPWQRGSYVCNQPGYFTTICGNEGKRVGNLHFAGEHADLFYEWQGFMEGAANSGIAAASTVLHDLRRNGAK